MDIAVLIRLIKSSFMALFFTLTFFEEDFRNRLVWEIILRCLSLSQCDFFGVLGGESIFKVCPFLRSEGDIEEFEGSFTEEAC